MIYWRKHLQKLEQSKQWDQVIAFMQKVIKKILNDMDARA